MPHRGGTHAWHGVLVGTASCPKIPAVGLALGLALNLPDGKSSLNQPAEGVGTDGPEK